MQVVFMSSNFTFAFRGIAGLPGSPIMAPLVRHIMTSTNFEVIELAHVLIEEHRLSEEESLELIQSLTRLVFQDVSEAPLRSTTAFWCSTSCWNCTSW